MDLKWALKKKLNRKNKKTVFQGPPLKQVGLAGLSQRAHSIDYSHAAHNTKHLSYTFTSTN